MNKYEFLHTLERSLKGFSGAEVARVLGYYDELISERVENGENEYTVIAEFGDIRHISRQIQAELASERLEQSIHEYKLLRKNRKEEQDDEPPFTAPKPPVRVEPQKGRYGTEIPYMGNQRQTYGAPYTPEKPYGGYGENLIREGTPESHREVADKRIRPKNTVSIVVRLFMTPALIPFGIVLFVLLVSLSIAVFSVSISLLAGGGAVAVATVPGIVYVAAGWGAGYAVLAGLAVIVSLMILCVFFVLSVKIGGTVLKLLLNGATKFVKWFYSAGGKA